MSADATSLGAGAVNFNTGKPVFVNAGLSNYTAVEREDLSATDRINYRQIKLNRAIEAISRRDAVYHDLAQENYTGGSVTHQVLGSPYPVIEPFPHVGECYRATRWYELAISIAAGVSWRYLHATDAAHRYIRNPRIGLLSYPMMITCASYSFFALRGQQRLLGMAENEQECDKFGVFDDAANLERKAKNWAKYAAFKEEWVRRYNYSAWGEVPGESTRFMSACWLPAAKVCYNTRTDYPSRKNPMFLSTAPLRDMQAEWAFIQALPPKTYGAEEKRSDDPAQYGRPELSHRYRGPIDNEGAYVKQV